MNIQLENWGIVKMNYSLLKEKEKREDNSLGLKFKNFFNDKYKKSFKIAFYLKLEGEDFNLDIDAIFNFTADKEITEEFKKSNFPRINAPAIAYPYLRAYVSNLTLQSGVNPAMLPTINFVKFENPDD